MNEKKIECDLKTCVLNWNGACRKTNIEEYPYYGALMSKQTGPIFCELEAIQERVRSCTVCDHADTSIECEPCDTCFCDEECYHPHFKRTGVYRND